MSIPFPVAELIISHLSDADLVCQRELYPVDVAQVLYQRRVARKVSAKWRRLVLFCKAKRMHEQFQEEVQHLDLTPITQQMDASPALNRLYVGPVLTMDDVSAACTKQKIKDIRPRFDEIMKADPALAIAIEEVTNGTGTVHDYFQAILQSNNLMQLMEVVAEVIAPAAPELVRLPSPDLK